MPVNPVSGKDNSLTGVGNDRPDVVSTTAYTGAPHGLFYQYINPNLYAPNANISSATFGQIRSARDPRILQASIKLTF